MALKKSELYSSLWSSCDELRGGMDASQYKDYVLVLLFIKYISDKYAGQPFAPITIPTGASFKDMIALKGKSAIYEHPEFATFIAGMNAHFTAWRQTSAATLKALQAGCHPKEIIVSLSEGLLTHYQGKPLIDPYDIYQHLMDYWAEALQDDVYLIAADGWKAETTRIIEKDKKGKEKDKGWTCDLIPKRPIVARYFAQEQAAIDQLAAELKNVHAKLVELEEEQVGEDGAFAELDKLNKANVTARLKEIKGDEEAKEEAAVLRTGCSSTAKRPTSRST